jgi:hypothetical protein
MLGDKHYDAKTIILITKVQARMRGFMAKKKVNQMKASMFGPGNMDGRYEANPNYDRVNVEAMRTTLGEFRYDDQNIESANTYGNRERRPEEKL